MPVKIDMKKLAMIKATAPEIECYECMLRDGRKGYGATWEDALERAKQSTIGSKGEMNTNLTNRTKQQAESEG